MSLDSLLPLSLFLFSFSHNIKTQTLFWTNPNSNIAFYMQWRVHGWSHGSASQELSKTFTIHTPKSWVQVAERAWRASKNWWIYPSPSLGPESPSPSPSHLWRNIQARNTHHQQPNLNSKHEPPWHVLEAALRQRQPRRVASLNYPKATLRATLSKSSSTQAGAPSPSRVGSNWFSRCRTRRAPWRGSRSFARRWRHAPRRGSPRATTARRTRDASPTGTRSCGFIAWVLPRTVYPTTVVAVHGHFRRRRGRRFVLSPEAAARMRQPAEERGEGPCWFVGSWRVGSRSNSGFLTRCWTSESGSTRWVGITARC